MRLHALHPLRPWMQARTGYCVYGKPCLRKLGSLPRGVLSKLYMRIVDMDLNIAMPPASLIILVNQGATNPM